MTFEQWLAANFPEFGVGSLTPEQRSRFNTLYEADIQSEPDADADLEASDGDADMEGSTDDTDLGAPKPKPAEEKSPNDCYAARKATRKMAGSKAPGSDGSSMDQSIERYNKNILRVEKISRLCASRHTDDKINDIYLKAIANADADERDVELAVMRAARSAPSGASSHGDESGIGDQALESEIIQAALLLSTGGNRMTASRLKEFGFSERAGNEATSKKWQRASLQTVCDHLARKAGCAAGPMESDQAKMQAARNATAKMQAAGFSMLQLNYILENVQNKILLDAYASVNVLWPKFVEPTNNPDFKIYGRYALDNQSVFQQIGQQGQLAELKYGDRKYTTELETYGGRFSVNRQTWINDDLGAINARIAQVGILGAKTLDLNAHLMLQNGINNTSMFHTQNGNYLANSTNYALGITGLQNARAAYVNQVGFDNQPLGVALDQMLVGSVLQPTANQLYTSAYLLQNINIAATAASPQQGDENPFRGMYTVTESTFLNNTAILDAYGNAIPHQDPGLWFLTGKQGNNAPFFVAFLNGQQAPTVLTEANTTSILGFELVVFLDFGFGYGDPRLAVCMNPNNA